MGLQCLAELVHRNDVRCIGILGLVEGIRPGFLTRGMYKVLGLPDIGLKTIDFFFEFNLECPKDLSPGF